MNLSCRQKNEGQPKDNDSNSLHDIVAVLSVIRLNNFSNRAERYLRCSEAGAPSARGSKKSGTSARENTSSNIGNFFLYRVSEEALKGIFVMAIVGIEYCEAHSIICFEDEDAFSLAISSSCSAKKNSMPPSVANFFSNS